MSDREAREALQRIMERNIDKMLAAIKRALASDSTQDHWVVGSMAEEAVHYGNLILGRLKGKVEGKR